MTREDNRHCSGFSLLEVIITIGILVAMMIAITTSLKSSFDMKAALSERSKVTRRLQIVMQRMVQDLTHVFFISPSDRNRMTRNRAWKTFFLIDRLGMSNKLALTTKSYLPNRQDIKESEIRYVVYSLKKDEKFSGRKNLYRGSTPYIPEGFRVDPPMQMFVPHIKTFNIQFWDSKMASFRQDRWDSRRERRIPLMLKIEIEAWAFEPDENRPFKSDDVVERLSTVVFLPYAMMNYDENRRNNMMVKYY